MFQTGFVNLYTNDIEAALRFYRDLLGSRAVCGRTLLAVRGQLRRF
jgi:catechol 2,3-dioxygenase-like lactoylglutathione lyase family enzyme